MAGGLLSRDSGVAISGTRWLPILAHARPLPSPPLTCPDLCTNDPAAFHFELDVLHKDNRLYPSAVIPVPNSLPQEFSGRRARLWLASNRCTPRGQAGRAAAQLKRDLPHDQGLKDETRSRQ